MTISVIIPLYNGQHFIQRALASVDAQSLPPHQVIIVDEGSTDDGVAVAREFGRNYPLQILPRQNAGRSAARNAGITHSTGDLIALLDQDDIWYPDHLEVLAQAFVAQATTSPGWAYSNFDEIDESGRLVARRVLDRSDSAHPKVDLRDCLQHDMLIRPSASLISRRAFDAVGGFDERLAGYQDDDLFVRLFSAGFSNVYVERPLSQWRVHTRRTACSPAMASGRMIYARKLIETYPDDLLRNIFFGRDIILPRFLDAVVETMRKALRAGDLALAGQCKSDSAELENLLPEADRHRLARTNLLITVVIPLYNGAPYIATALESVFRQTLPPDEIIVVNDGSDDDGLAIVQKLAATRPLRVLSKPNGGQSSARNHGIQRAHGDLIALLDQDDVWYPTHLAELVAPFRQARSRPLGWAYSNLDEIGRSGELVKQCCLTSVDVEHPKTNVADCLGQDMFVLPSASLVSRMAFEAVGGFDERLSGYEDDDLFVRLLHAGYDNVYIDKALSQWRIYPESSSYSPRMARSRMVYARKLIERFPNDQAKARLHVRDLIAPRFVTHALQEVRKALALDDDGRIDAAFDDLKYLERFLKGHGGSGVVKRDLLITAIIPLFNGAAFIEEAIESIVGQILKPDEIIVVDDGSTDAGPEIVARLAQTSRIRLIRQQNAGQSAARNIGVEHAHGDLIAFLDQDDAWYPNHLSELVKPFLEERSLELGWAYSNLDEITLDGEVVCQGFLDTFEARHPKRDISSCIARDMFVLPSASLISLRAFASVGGFDERLSGYEDDDLFLRLFRAGFDNVFLPRSLSKWRIYPDSSSYSPRMARSRMIYARKLIEQFPDDLAKGHLPVRDLIAPRFVTHALEEVRKALALPDEAWVDAACEDLQYLERFLKGRSGPGVIRRDLLITAIIPLFNGADFIEEAIESIVSQILKPDEIIVVDDGSTDAGPEIVMRLAQTNRIRLIRQENSGQSSARNIGVEHAHGDLIAFLDQDDAWYPNHLTELVKPFLEERPLELGWAYSNLDEVNLDGELVCQGFLDHFEAKHPKRDICSCIARDMFVLPSASLISRRAFLSVGGFDERLSGYEDDDLFLRLFRAGFENVFLPRSLSKWRIHPGSSSYSSRMAVSRATYARKLIERYPDDPDTSRYYVRDFIAPRFFHGMARELRVAVLKDAAEQQATALANLRFIIGHLRLTRRLPLQLVFLPAMQIPPLAKFIMRHRILLHILVRQIVRV